jgi:Domain of Unknown Function with PDB structure (DUF3857)/Transglutaminase-like superfamily
MKPPRPSARARSFRPALFLLAAAFALAPAFDASASGGDKDWRPVDPSQLSMTAPVVEKDADAEALFWEVRVVYEDSGGEPSTVLNHYVRIKIFNERGRESQSKVELPSYKYRGRTIKIKDIAARTIKPDGSTVELKKEDIFERDVVKANGLKVKAMTFAMPGVEAGSIIEYRWREVRDGISNYERFQFSRDIPVQWVRYSIKPYGSGLVDDNGRPVGLRAKTFQTSTDVPFSKEKDGSYSLTLAKVAAFHEEPRMPPENSVRPWMLVYYKADMPMNPELYWAIVGRNYGLAAKSVMKVNDDIRRAAAEAAAGAKSPEETLHHFYDYARSHVKRYTDDASGLTAEQIKKIKENKSPADTLKRGVGTSRDIDLLFGALASAAGFDARIALTSDREDIFFDRSFPDDYFINPSSVAVKVEGAWRLFNPGMSYVPFGMLRWQEEGQPTLIADENAPAWIGSPMSGPEKSLEKRTGKFTLSEDGTLEGDVRIEYTGHIAADLKEYNDDDSPEQREETLRNKLKEQMPAAEVSNIKIENVTDPDKPFTYEFHVRVPAYATRTGKRLFVQPAFFQYRVGAMFPTGSRANEVYFHYPWSEEDYVEMRLPDGYALDTPEAPGRIGAGDLSQYVPSAGVSKDGHTLVWGRKFYFGGSKQPGGSSLIFPVASYSALKGYFDEVNKQDATTLALKQSATTASATTAPQN